MLKIYSTKTNIITTQDTIDIYVDGKRLSSETKYYLKTKYKYCNVHINNFGDFISVCNVLKSFDNIPVNVILNGIKLNQVKEPKKIVEGFKLLPDNIKISYKKLTEDRKVVDKEYESINPWLTNLSKDDFEFMVTKFHDDEKRYVLMQEQIIKNVHNTLKNTYDSFDELSDKEKIELVYNYVNTHVEVTNDRNDPIETAINKKGDLKSIKELFVILTNNRHMKLKTSYVEDKMIHGLHFYDFDKFTGKNKKKIL